MKLVLLMLFAVSAQAQSKFDRLVCQSNGQKSAIFNYDKNKFIDPYYAKTHDECNRTIRASRRGFTCASNSDGKTAIYNYVAEKYEDAYYDKTVDDCIEALYTYNSNSRLTCKSNGDKAALFDRERNKFIDPYYAKTLSECNRTVRYSRRGFTCASNSDGKTAMYDYINERYVDPYYSKTLEECLGGL